MLLELARWLQQLDGLFRLFNYITFRGILAALTALGLSLWLGPAAIRRLAQLKGGQPIRKDGPQSAEYTTSAFKWDGRSLKLAKMDAPLAIRWSRTIPKAAKVTTVTVSKDAAGRYFVSMLCTDQVQAKAPVAAKVGIDLGLTHFAILSTGEKIAAPNTFRKNEEKLAKLQRRLAKKTKGSANRKMAKL